MADTTKKASVQIVNEEQENMAVEEVETTEEETKTLIRMNEEDFIQGLISAADYTKDDTQRIEIARNGKVLFAFDIRPLSEEEYNKGNRSKRTWRNDGYDWKHTRFWSHYRCRIDCGRNSRYSRRSSRRSNTCECRN